MKKIFVLALSFLFIAVSVRAQKPVMVGGAMMYASKNIVENAMNSKEHTTLVAAVKAADLVAALQGSGPFTVFAPTNAAFEKLPEGTVQNLLKTENKKQLQAVLTYHVVKGRWNAQDLKKMIRRQKGTATIETLSGGKIYASLDSKGQVWISDAMGGKAMVTTGNVHQSNGVIHVIDHVLLPRM